MALQVWLPLNGDLHNQGLSSVTVTNSSATVNNSGKIGKCYSFNGSSSGLAVDKCPFQGKSEFSISVWCYPNTTTLDGLFGHQSVTNYYQLAIVNDGGCCLKWRDNGTQSPIGTWVFASSVTASTWQHWTFTYNNGLFSAYKDGVLIGTKQSAGTAMNSVEINQNYIVRTPPTIHYFNGKINDFRIYDHCLSPKEVKEISKGLVLHYKLDGRDILMSKCKSVTYNQLVQNGDFANGTSNWLQTTTSTISVSSGVLTLTKTDGVGVIGGIYRSGSMDGRANTTHKYYIKSKLKCNTADQFIAFGFHTSSGSVGGNANYISYIYEHDYVVASNIVSPANNTDIFAIRAGNSQSPLGTNGSIKYIMCIDLTNMFGSGKEPTLAEADMMFDRYMEYNTGTTMDLSTPVYDCSGYENNGTITGTISPTSITSRYKYGASFEESDCIIKSTLILLNDYKYTASFWINPHSISSSTQWIFAIGSGSNHQFGCYINNTTINTQVGGVVGSATTSWSYRIAVNNWYHIAIVSNGVNVSVYVNGTSLGTNSINGSTTGSTFWIGKRPGESRYYNYNGILSDFRIYSTALSTDDIKELYDTSAFIYNDATIAAREFSEEGTSEDITKTGIVKVGNLVELASNTLVLSDGSLWVRLLHHNNPSSYMFTSSNCWHKTDNENLYSVLNLLKSTAWANGDGEYEFLFCEKLTSSSSEQRFRWKQTSNPALSSTLSGYQLISGNPGRTIGIMNKGAYAAMHNGNSYWCQCGAYSGYNGGIAGASGTVTTGYFDLYVRLFGPIIKGADANLCQFYENSIVAKEIIEI